MTLRYFTEKHIDGYTVVDGHTGDTISDGKPHMKGTTYLSKKDAEAMARKLNEAEELIGQQTRIIKKLIPKTKSFNIITAANINGEARIESEHYLDDDLFDEVKQMIESIMPVIML